MLTAAVMFYAFAGDEGCRMVIAIAAIWFATDEYTSWSMR